MSHSKQIMNIHMNIAARAVNRDNKVRTLEASSHPNPDVIFIPQPLISSPEEATAEITVQSTEDGSEFIIENIAATSDKMSSEATTHMESHGSITTCSDFKVLNACSNSPPIMQLPHTDECTKHSYCVVTNPVVISHLKKRMEVKFKRDRLDSYVIRKSLKCLKFPDNDICTNDEPDPQKASSSNVNTVIHKGQNSFKGTRENVSITKQGKIQKKSWFGGRNFEFHSYEKEKLQRTQSKQLGLGSLDHSEIPNLCTNVCNIVPNSSTNTRNIVPNLNDDSHNILEEREDEERTERLQIHKNIYVGRNPYECENCDYFTVDKYKYTIHQRIHSGEKPFKCDECDFCTTYKSVLKVHQRSHNGERPYKCDSCSYSCVTSSALRVHKRKHTGERPFKCSLCDFYAARKADLKYHLRTHTGEKPYKCDGCDYEAATISQVKVHHRIHTGEKPYKCDQCDYCSAQKYKITIHQRVHTGDKPYKCDTCEFHSTQKYKIKLHKQQTHAAGNSHDKSETKNKRKLKASDNKT